MNLGALLEGKLGESEKEEEEHEESDSSAFDKFYDALKSDDREAAKDALNHVVYEHMMEMDDEGEAEDEKGGVLIAMSPKKDGEMNSDRELKQGKKKKVDTSERKRLRGHYVDRYGRGGSSEIEPYEEWMARYGDYTDGEIAEYGDPRRKRTPGEMRRGRRNPAGWARGLGNYGPDEVQHPFHFETSPELYFKRWPGSRDPAVLAEHDKQIEKHFAKIRLQNKRDKVGQYSPREEARRKGWAKAHARKKKELNSDKRLKQRANDGAQKQSGAPDGEGPKVAEKGNRYNTRRRGKAAPAKGSLAAALADELGEDVVRNPPKRAESSADMLREALKTAKEKKRDRDAMSEHQRDEDELRREFIKSRGVKSWRVSRKGPYGS